MANTFDYDRLFDTGRRMQSDRSEQEPRRQNLQTDDAAQVAAPVTTRMPIIQQSNAKIASFLAGEIRRPSHKITSLNRWPDKKPGMRKVYNLFFFEAEAGPPQQAQDKKLALLGLTTLHNITTKPSPRDVGNLMLLAYNLVDSSGQHIFGDVPVDLQDMTSMEEFDNLSDRPIKIMTPASLLTVDFDLGTPERVNAIKVAVCYIACTYMRLYTKSASSYSKIGNRIHKRFENFYGFPLPLSNFHPDDEAIITVKAQLELNTILRATFYNFLYAGEMCEEGANLKKFLYEIHVAYTGLHPYTLFVRCMEVLRVSNRELAEDLYSKNIEPELRALADVFTHISDTANDEYKYQMWRFARIFNQNFLSILQTKNCIQFTMILANLLSIADPTGHRDVLKIAQIQGSSKELKMISRRFAERAAYIIFAERMSFTDNYTGLADTLIDVPE